MLLRYGGGAPTPFGMMRSMKDAEARDGSV
jgi:hypothetical protein